MARQVLPFKLYESKDISGLVKEDNLNYNYMIEPQNATQHAITLLAANVGVDMNVFLNKFPVKEFETQDDIVWDLVTGNDKNVALEKAEVTVGTELTSSSTDKPGINYSSFYLYFPENRFFVTDTLAGEKNEIYPLRVTKPPTQVGSLWRYEVQLLTGDSDLYVPVEELVRGKRFSRDAPSIETSLSKDGAGVSHNFPYKMLTNMSSFRMEYTSPGNMVKRPLSVSWKDAKTGKVITNWLDKLQWDFEQQYQKFKNYMYMYSVSNRADDGTFKQRCTSGEIIKRGPGLKQLMESSNYYTYNELDIEKFTEMLLDLSVNRLAMGEREVVVTAGEYGMYEWHKALESLSTLYTPARDNSRIYNAKSPDGIGSAMGYRGQFFEFIGPNGVKVNIMHDATKDDRYRFKENHPTKPGTLESYNYDILNLGTVAGEPNIQKCVLSNGGSEVRAFIPGIRNPWNFKVDGGTYAATPIDGFQEVRMFAGGVLLYDPSRTATYKLNVV